MPGGRGEEEAEETTADEEEEEAAAAAASAAPAARKKVPVFSKTSTAACISKEEASTKETGLCSPSGRDARGAGRSPGRALEVEVEVERGGEVDVDVDVVGDGREAAGFGAAAPFVFCLVELTRALLCEPFAAAAAKCCRFGGGGGILWPRPESFFFFPPRHLLTYGISEKKKTRPHFSLDLFPCPWFCTSKCKAKTKTFKKPKLAREKNTAGHSEARESED